MRNYPKVGQNTQHIKNKIYLTFTLFSLSSPKKERINNSFEPKHDGSDGSARPRGPGFESR